MNNKERDSRIEELKKVLLTHDGKGLKAKEEALKEILDIYYKWGQTFGAFTGND